MTWLTPWTGFFLALAVIPPLILLYFLKLRRKSQPIACTLLWKRSVEDLQANAPFQRIRWNILLLLQLLAILLLILSVMQPRVQAGNPIGGRTVFLIDNSASMSATDVATGETRLDVAKRLAKERIETMYAGGLFAGAPGEAMIVAYSDRAEIVARFTNSRQQLLTAIDRIPQTHGESRIDEALKLARAYTVNVVDEMGEARPTGDPPHLELFSDGNITDLPEQVLRGETLTFHAIGSAEPDNLALAAIAAERPFDRPTAIEVFASILNFNQSEAICDVQLSISGAARGINTVTVPPAEIDPATGQLIPGRNNIVFTPFEQPAGAVIEVANLRADDLMVDNIAQLVVPPPRRLSVALVQPDSRNDLLLLAFEGMPIIEKLDVLTPRVYEQLASAGPIDGYDVIVLQDYQPKDMPSGRYLVFGPAPPIEGFHAYGQSPEQLILDTREEHLIMRFVNLTDLYIQRATLVEPGEDVEVLATMRGAPAIMAVQRGSLDVVYVAFEVADTTWPYEFSYVTFLQNAVEFLGHSGEPITSIGFRPGEALTTRLPSAATNIELRTPDGRTERIDVVDPARFSWGPCLSAGVYWVSWDEPGVSSRQTRALAVNLLSETEGMLAVSEDIQIGQEVRRGRRADSGRYIPLWPWAIGLCLALLMIEWWIYHRKSSV